MTQRPDPPSRPREESRTPSRVLSCAGFLFVGLAMLAGFTLLAFLSQGLLLPVILVVGGVFGVVFFHYLIWGWWLGGIIREEARREAEAEEEESSE